MDLDAVQWLLTDDGQRVLGQAVRAGRAGPAAGPLPHSNGLSRHAVRRCWPWR